MSIIKERILFNNQDVNLKINLGAGDSVYGYQLEIDDLTEETKEDLINPVIDYEVQRFSQKTGLVRIFNFLFNGQNSADFTDAGFTTSEIEDSDDVLLNSFFIMDFYDSFNPYTQNKIFTIYNTKVLNGSTSGGVQIPAYVVNDNNLNQFYHWFIPKSYLDAQTGNTVTGYIKFSFYNAKTGFLHLFLNRLNAGLTTPKKLYFEVELNLDDMTWELVGTFFFGSVPIEEILPRSSAYVSRANETFSNFDNLQQQPPTGAFNPEDGTYD